MKNNYIAITAIILSVIAIFISLSSNATAQSVSVIVPPLSKDSSYSIIIPRILPSCVDIENKLGLSRGSVESISDDHEKGIIIKFKKDIALDSLQVQTATDTVKGLVPNIEVK